VEPFYTGDVLVTVKHDRIYFLSFKKREFNIQAGVYKILVLVTWIEGIVLNLGAYFRDVPTVASSGRD